MHAHFISTNQRGAVDENLIFVSTVSSMLWAVGNMPKGTYALVINDLYNGSNAEAILADLEISTL